MPSGYKETRARPHPKEGAMARWSEFVDAEPDLAVEVRGVFEAHTHKAIGTLRADGSPRVSGVECEFDHGELSFGMMPGSQKARDLQRDPRMEIHSATVDPDGSDPATWQGDAKISGRVTELKTPEERAPFSDDPAATHHLFRVDIERVVRIKLEGKPLQLVVLTWRPGRAVERAVPG
jgi:hypothetical protein